MADAHDLAKRLLAGERPALARMISWAENGDPRFASALAEIYPRVGRAWRIGVTGPPGAGKSSLVNALIEHLRARGNTVAVLAIDPTSPYSGGALLGDRIRMEERTTDAGVFIRSMATRASHGGLARAAVDACDAMDTGTRPRSNGGAWSVPWGWTSGSQGGRSPRRQNQSFGRSGCP